MFQPEMCGFGSKVSYKTENHSQLSQNLQYFHKIKSSLKLMISFCYLWKKIELDFGYGLCWRSFCLNRVLKEQFVKVLAIFFRTTVF